MDLRFNLQRYNIIIYIVPRSAKKIYAMGN